MKVSVLILSFNEERNLPRCLDALSWCDDIVLLDSGSTDQTVTIAMAKGARVLRRAFDDFASQRNFGLIHGDFKNDWILHLDADEMVTPQFVTVLDQLSPCDAIYAYRVPSKLMLWGRWLRHSGMYPTYQVRLGRREVLKFIQVGHGQRESVESKFLGTFPEPYLHFSFSYGMRNWLEKHIRYAQDEANLLAGPQPANDLSGTRWWRLNATQRRRWAKQRASNIPLVLRPVARFLYVYIMRAGFRDGSVGFAYAIMLSVYEGMIAVFRYEQLLGAASNPKITAASKLNTKR